MHLKSRPFDILGGGGGGGGGGLSLFYEKVFLGLKGNKNMLALKILNFRA